MVYRLSALTRRRIELALHAVAVAFNVEAQELKAPSRGDQNLALARQIVMYLAHVALGISKTHIALGLGRDRSTAWHACRAIEDKRDEPDFDERVRGIESALSVLRHESDVQYAKALAAEAECAQ